MKLSGHCGAGACVLHLSHDGQRFAPLGTSKTRAHSLCRRDHVLHGRLVNKIWIAFWQKAACFLIMHVNEHGAGTMRGKKALGEGFVAVNLTMCRQGIMRIEVMDIFHPLCIIRMARISVDKCHGFAKASSESGVHKLAEIGEPEPVVGRRDFTDSKIDMMAHIGNALLSGKRC